MDQILRNKLNHIATEFSHEGVEALDNLEPSDYLDLESMLNTAISEAEDWEQDDILKIRFLFRIWLKYGTDISRGIQLLQTYEE